MRPIALFALLFILLLNSFVTSSCNKPLQVLDDQHSNIKSTLATCQFDGALGGAAGSIILPILASICLRLTKGQSTFFTLASAAIGSLIGYNAGYASAHKTVTKSKPEGSLKKARHEAFKTGLKNGFLTSVIIATLVIPKDYELKRLDNEQTLLTQQFRAKNQEIKELRRPLEQKNSYTDFDTYSPRTSN